MQKEKSVWKQRVYYLSKLAKDIIKSKLKYKKGGDLYKEVNLAIDSLQKNIMELELDKRALEDSLDKCRCRCWDCYKENGKLKSSGHSLSIED